MLIEIDGVIVESANLKAEPLEDPSEIQTKALDVAGVTVEELYADDRISQRQLYLQTKGLLNKHIDPFNKLDKAFLIGYNTGFDEDFLRKLWLSNNDNYFNSWFWYPTIDVAVLAMDQLESRRHELVNFRLETVYEFLFHESFQAHDALADIEATRRIYLNGKSNSRPQSEGAPQIANLGNPDTNAPSAG